MRTRIGNQLLFHHKIMRRFHTHLQEPRPNIVTPVGIGQETMVEQRRTIFVQFGWSSDLLNNIIKEWNVLIIIYENNLKTIDARRSKLIIIFGFLWQYRYNSSTERLYLYEKGDSLRGGRN